MQEGGLDCSRCAIEERVVCLVQEGERDRSFVLFELCYLSCAIGGGSAIGAAVTSVATGFAVGAELAIGAAVTSVATGFAIGAGSAIGAAVKRFLLSLLLEQEERLGRCSKEVSTGFAVGAEGATWALQQRGFYWVCYWSSRTG